MFFKFDIMFDIFVQAVKKHKKRVDVFEDTPAEHPIEEQATKLMRKARGTIIEKNFLDALAKPLTTVGQKKQEVNDTTQRMDAAELAMDDIEPTLWRFCQMVVGGVPLA